MLDQGDADMLADAADEFRKDAPSAAIFLNHGQPWKPGQRLVQTDLARSLSLIAEKRAGGLLQWADRGEDRRREQGRRRDPLDQAISPIIRRAS